MTNWRSFPEKGWLPIGSLLSGHGDGVGSYGAAYAINTKIGPILNGRMSAFVRLGGDRQLVGGGLIARADTLYSFLTMYLVSDKDQPGTYTLRLAAFKHGKIVFLKSLRDPVIAPDREYHGNLQFFSGDAVAEVSVGNQIYSLKHTVPEAPFRGYCGTVRFYDTSALVREVIIEEISMRSILPEPGNDKKKYDFDVFLSHSSLDKSVVLGVTKAFKEAGIRYWVDHEQITFGDSIVAKIENGLQQSKYVVVCISKNLSASAWSREEYGAILYREFSGDTSRRVIPLSLDGSTDTQSVPLLLSDKLRANYADKQDFAKFLQCLRTDFRPGC